MANIFQVLKETDIEEILEEHTQSLVLIMVSSKGCPPCAEIRPKFIKLAKDNPDCFFVYIDRSNFIPPKSDFFKGENVTPKFLFYFNIQEIAEIIGAHEDAIVKTLHHIKSKIEAKKKEFLEKEFKEKEKDSDKEKETVLKKVLDKPLDKPLEKPIDKSLQKPLEKDSVKKVDEQVILKKLDLLKKLYELSQNGFKLTQNYNLDSNIEQMQMEYEIVVKNQNDIIVKNQDDIVVKNQDDITVKNQEDHVVKNSPELEAQKKNSENDEETLKKQEQMKKIQEINRLNYMMQMQELYKLQQLKQLHKIKEDREKQERQEKKEEKEK